MKKFLPTLLMVAVLAAGTVHAANDLAFVDMQEVFKQFYKTQMAQEQIRQQADDIKLEREEMEDEVKAMKEEVDVLRADSRDETLSEEVRENKRDQLEEKLVDLQQKEMDAIEFEKLRMEQMKQQNTRMTKKLYDEVHEAVINYSKSKGFDAVIDRSAKAPIGTDIMLYVSTKVDITADVLLSLNEGRENIRAEKTDLEVGE